ncbi:hypothetical protein, partial [Stigmatella erecta]|uniref:hypothetical protein n=1 Tax=Stigmatella erecta TaxID=83460 RepID=UPI001C432426
FRPAGRAFYFVLRRPVNFAGDYSFCQSPARFPARLASVGPVRSRGRGFYLFAAFCVNRLR